MAFFKNHNAPVFDTGDMPGFLPIFISGKHNAVTSKSRKYKS